jgi:hypothetical protein
MVVANRTGTALPLRYGRCARAYSSLIRWRCGLNLALSFDVERRRMRAFSQGRRLRRPSPRTTERCLGCSASDRLAPPNWPNEYAASSSLPNISNWTSHEAEMSLPVIQACDDRSARICVLCHERRPGAHFGIRPLKGAGYRVVCGPCLRGLVDEKKPIAKRRK